MTTKQLLERLSFIQDSLNDLRDEITNQDVWPNTYEGELIRRGGFSKEGPSTYGSDYPPAKTVGYGINPDNRTKQLNYPESQNPDLAHTDENITVESQGKVVPDNNIRMTPLNQLGLLEDKEQLERMKSSMTDSEFREMYDQKPPVQESPYQYEDLDPRYPIFSDKQFHEAVVRLNEANWDPKNLQHYKRYQRLKGGAKNFMIKSKFNNTQVPITKPEPLWDGNLRNDSK